MKSLETCREIAARVWCDPDFSDVVMDQDACEEIARILYNLTSKPDPVIIFIPNDYTGGD